MRAIDILDSLDNQFYPTPKNVAEELFSMVEYHSLLRVLEPSAGKGDLIDAFIEYIKKNRYYGYNAVENLQVDTIEKDFNLQGILKNKGYRVVHDDFLTYQTPIEYSTILMNPPFKNGESHLLKAIDLLKVWGGNILCILNAETIKNPYSNSRKILANKLEEFKKQSNLKIKYLKNSFIDAERKTDVEVALIYIKVDKNIEDFESDIFQDMKKTNDEEIEKKRIGNYLTKNNLIDSLIEQYNLEIKSGTKLIREFLKLQSINLIDDSSLIGNLNLRLYQTEITNCNPGKEINEYIKQARFKYWKYLFKSNELGNMLTSEQRDNLYNNLEEFSEYEFNAYNIFQLKDNIISNVSESIDNSIMNLFETLSSKYSYDSSIENKNIHYYNGWKTNKAHKINKKCIIPYNSTPWYSNNFDITRNQEQILDLIIALGYLDGKTINRSEIYNTLDITQGNKIFKNVELPYIKIDFFKKGTAHIKFTDLELLKKLNRYAAKNRNWLPPSYGKKNYDDMTNEEKKVVEEFEGKETYQKDLEEGKLFIDKNTAMLAIGSKLQG